MNPPPLGQSAYLGLFGALVLALTCNTFLDIQYGSFGFEVTFWAVVQGWTLLAGWRRASRGDGSGARAQWIVLVAGLAISMVILIPKWGFPRAGIYMLALLQAAMNCVLTTRRQLYLGLLVSAVMVMFAASHFRADWTMLFYLLPYLVAAVFTMVADQIGGRARSLGQTSLGTPVLAGSGVAVAAATGMILLIGAGLYLVTPQLTRPYLEWRYGQLSNLAHGQEPNQTDPGQGTEAQASNGPNEGSNGGQAAPGASPAPGQGWPSAAQMREAARRPGMPEWQSAAMLRLANVDEALRQALAPVAEALASLRAAWQEWLEANRDLVRGLLQILALAALLAVLALLLWAFNLTTWVRTRFDYLTLALLGAHPGGTRGARRYYRAMERLFALRDLPRLPRANAREYLATIAPAGAGVQAEIAELTDLFEQYRYGASPPDARQLARMRGVYRALYEKFA